MKITSMYLTSYDVKYFVYNNIVSLAHLRRTTEISQRSRSFKLHMRRNKITRTRSTFKLDKPKASHFILYAFHAMLREDGEVNALVTILQQPNPILHVETMIFGIASLGTMWTRTGRTYTASGSSAARFLFCFSKGFYQSLVINVIYFSFSQCLLLHQQNVENQIWIYNGI